MNLDSVDLVDGESYFCEGSRGFSRQSNIDAINANPVTDFKGVSDQAFMQTGSPPYLFFIRRKDTEYVVFVLVEGGAPGAEQGDLFLKG